MLDVLCGQGLMFSLRRLWSFHCTSSSTVDSTGPEGGLWESSFLEGAKKNNKPPLEACAWLTHTCSPGQHHFRRAGHSSEQDSRLLTPSPTHPLSPQHASPNAFTAPVLSEWEGGKSCGTQFWGTGRSSSIPSLSPAQHSLSPVCTHPISLFNLYRYKKHLPCSIALLGTSWVTHTHHRQLSEAGRVFRWAQGLQDGGQGTELCVAPAVPPQLQLTACQPPAPATWSPAWRRTTMLVKRAPGAAPAQTPQRGKGPSSGPGCCDEEPPLPAPRASPGWALILSRRWSLPAGARHLQQHWLGLV